MMRLLSVVALLLIPAMALAQVPGKEVPQEVLDMVGTWETAPNPDYFIRIVVNPNGKVFYEFTSKNFGGTGNLSMVPWEIRKDKLVIFTNIPILGSEPNGRRRPDFTYEMKLDKKKKTVTLIETAMTPKNKDQVFRFVLKQAKP